jgi:hypothetical protein
MLMRLAVSVGDFFPFHHQRLLLGELFTRHRSKMHDLERNAEVPLQLSVFPIDWLSSSPLRLSKKCTPATN